MWVRSVVVVLQMWFVLMRFGVSLLNAFREWHRQWKICNINAANMTGFPSCFFWKKIDFLWEGIQPRLIGLIIKIFEVVLRVSTSLIIPLIYYRIGVTAMTCL